LPGCDVGDVPELLNNFFQTLNLPGWTGLVLAGVSSWNSSTLETSLLARFADKEVPIKFYVSGVPDTARPDFGVLRIIVSAKIEDRTARLRLNFPASTNARHRVNGSAVHAGFVP
jgi:hypothetical protein